LDQAETGNTKTKTKTPNMSPRRQLGLSITFVDDDDAVMRVPGIFEKETSPTVAVVTPPSDERWAGFGSAAEKAQVIVS
jgi:hypothetical protein